MKRLITFFQNKCGRSVMTLLLLFATSVCWADGIIHIWDADLNKDVIDLKLDYNNTSTGTKSFPMQANKKYGFVFRDVVNKTTTEYRLSGSMDICPDNKYKLLKDDGNSGYIKSEISGNCTFTVQWDGSTPYLTVSYKVKDKLRYKLEDTDIYAYADLAYDNKKGITNISMIDDKTYDFQICDEKGIWYGNTGKMTSYNNQNWDFQTNTSACKIQTSNQGTNIYSYSRVYTFKTDWTSGSLKVSATYQNVGDYYLIVPNENVGNTARAISESWVPTGHKAFKITGSRERNQKILNPDLTSVTLKIDGQQLRYDNNQKIRFYIYDKANSRYYQPNTDTEITQMYFTSNGRDGIGRSHDDIKTDKTGKYYYIDEEHAKTYIDGTVYPTKSLTFMFSQYNAEKNFYNDDKINIDGHFSHGNSIYYVNGKDRVLGNAKLMVAFLKTRGVGSKYYGEHITKSANGNEAGVYLVGNMGGDGYKNGSESDYDKSKYKMVRNLWKDGKIKTDISEAEADSIVYSCEINRGTSPGIWDEFFLAFTTGDMLGQTSKMWNPLLRPRVQNKIDAQALEGGIFYYLSDGGEGSDQAQSLNPLLTEDQKNRYVSYKVYFNATYSTYRIEFFDGFYIAGTAVHGQTGPNSDYLESANRIPMREQTINSITHYEYTGTFTQGGEFAFFVNDKTYTNNYSEDDDAAAVNLTYDKKWTTQAPVDGGGKATGKDYPYYNHVRYNTTGVDASKSLGVTDGKTNNTIKWTLPTGEYTLRFYYGGINGLKDAEKHPKALYTIDKVVTLYNVTSKFDGVDHNYGGWYPFSDDCALWLPTGIKAYYVSNIKEGKAVLTEVDDNTIPANFGVLLYDSKLNTKGASNPIKLHPVATDETGKDYTTESTATNYLVNCAKHDPTTKIQPITGEGANKKYNYFFTPKYYINEVLTDVPQNFWKTKTDATAVKNGTYLSVSTEVLPVAFNSTDNNYEYETNSKSVAMNARNYCFPLSFDGFDDTIITGIVSIDNDKVSENSDAWYTIQGVKTSKPSVSGIYIHNGKKVIIK